MKLQGMTIVYILIIIPIFFVISLALSAQAQIIQARLEYDKKVYGAAADAVKAFEINTANEDFNKVNDVLASIVEASVNVFKDSMATRLGMSNASKQYIDTYFPLAFFTLYDGFYTSAPTSEPDIVIDAKGNAVHIDDNSAKSYTLGNGLNVTSVNIDKEKLKEKNDLAPVIGPAKGFTSNNVYKPVVFRDKNGGGYTTKIEEAKANVKHVLKNYTPYSARYEVPGGGNIYINYTLDNYITLTGTMGNGENQKIINKGGYLLNKETKISKIEGLEQYNNILLDTKNGTDKIIDNIVDKKVEQLRNIGTGKISITVDSDYLTRFDTSKDKNTMIADKLENPLKIEYDVEDEKENGVVLRKPKNVTASDQAYQTYKFELAKYNSKTAYAKQQIDAIKYYLKAVRFSKWVYENLGELRVNNTRIDSLEEIRLNYPTLFNTYSDKNEKIFDGNVLDGGSIYNTHKKQIIRDTIQYGLIVSAINYNSQKYGNEPEFKLPVIAEPDWDKIVGNIAFTVFAEGMGDNKEIKYNNYHIAISTNNEFNIAENAMVYVQKEAFNTEDYYILNPNPNILPYYYNIYSKEFTSKEAQNNNKKILGEKIIRFENDGEYDKNLKKYFFDHKNYADQGIINPEVREEAPFTDMQKRIASIAYSAQKEGLVKLARPSYDSTLMLRNSKNIETPVEVVDANVISAIGTNKTLNKVVFNVEIPLKDISSTTEYNNRYVNSSAEIYYEIKDISGNVLETKIVKLSTGNSNSINGEVKIENLHPHANKITAQIRNIKTGEGVEKDTARISQLKNIRIYSY